MATRVLLSFMTFVNLCFERQFNQFKLSQLLCVYANLFIRISVHLVNKCSSTPE